MRDFWGRIKTTLSSQMGRFDDWLEPVRILGLAVSVLTVFILLALIVTLLNAKYYYNNFDFCVEMVCFSNAWKAFEVQLAILAVGGQVSAFVALILGPYVALKGYLSTANAEAFGNHISHIAFFERFISSEVRKRDRIRAGSIDVYSLYRLLFPESGKQAIHASADFKSRAIEVRDYISNSNSAFETLEASFDFSSHRKGLTEVVSFLFISIHNSPRIDFLESEDQVLDFIQMLGRVFCKREDGFTFPTRLYR